MVTSPSPAEGKSTSVASLAAAFADNGLRTLVVDGDFRRPAVARYLSPVPNLVDPDRPASTRIDGVSFIAAPRNVDTPADAVYRLRRSIAQWQDQFDIILLDTPPMLTTNDATDLLAAADAVVLVLRAGQTRTGPAERVANVLSRFRADVLGIVLNGCDNADMDPYYAYGYGYGYSGRKGKGGPGSGVFSPSAKHDPEWVAPTNGNGNGTGNGDYTAPSVFDDDAAAPAASSPTQPD
jgi:Mrp family chromosome partitioning ATPase